MRAVLLDVEGTALPVGFVYETLFPLANLQMWAFLTTHRSDPEIAQTLQALHDENRSDISHGALPLPMVGTDDFLAKSLNYLTWLAERDRKSPALKIIQGRIWQSAFEGGLLRSPVFEDVPRALARWTGEGRRVAIYSSGSVLAQKLVFRYSDHGNLSGFISAYFDTTTGRKNNPESYRRIAESLRIGPEGITFLSDSTAEVEAARDAGLVTKLCFRPGNQPLSDDSRNTVIRSFDEV